MDWMCDVYVYRTDLGYECRVAVNRFAGEELLPIGLSRDGQLFRRDSPGECADLLVDLQGEGYNVPEEAINELRLEQVDVEGVQ